MTFRSLIPFGRALPARQDDDPFGSLRREMDRMFDDFGRGWPAFSGVDAGTRGFLSPKVDIAETEKGLELIAELPGVDEKDIDLELADGVLTLKAEHKTHREEKDEKKRYHLVERVEGSFMRRFQLPFDVDEDRIEAHFDKGVLHLFVPRSAAAEKSVRKIAIGGGKGGESTVREAA